jgi:hypothetical protein
MGRADVSHQIDRRRRSPGAAVSGQRIGLLIGVENQQNRALRGDNGSVTVRRLKTYTGAQGYVYQYYFVGKRAALPDDPEAPAIEFIFDVTSDRKITYSVSVFFPKGPLEEWTAVHGRSLNEAEQYAAVKLRLFRAFDELDDVKTQGRRLTIDAVLLEEALSSLGVD